MQSETDDYVNAANEYYKRLNSVNLLLLKEHTFLLEKKQYQEEIEQIDALIATLKSSPSALSHLSVNSEFNYLHKIIKNNKKEISQLNSKLEKRQAMIDHLSKLGVIHNKYEKLINTDYQNGIQQKLSMIRGKVDDLKKKIKEINKDILSYQQEHAELIDQYSFQVRNLEILKDKNLNLTKEIEQLKAMRRK